MDHRLGLGPRICPRSSDCRNRLVPVLEQTDRKLPRKSIRDPLPVLSLAVRVDRRGGRQSHRDHQPTGHRNSVSTDDRFGARHQRVGLAQCDCRERQGSDRDPVYRLGMAVYPTRKPHPLHSRCDGLHRCGQANRTEFRWTLGCPRWGRRGFLCLHRFRCGLDGCPRDQKTRTRYADRHPRFALDLHRFVHPL